MGCIKPCLQDLWLYARSHGWGCDGRPGGNRMHPSTHARPLGTPHGRLLLLVMLVLVLVLLVKLGRVSCSIQGLVCVVGRGGG